MMISDMKFFFSEIELFLYSISSRWKYILVKIKAYNNSISRIFFCRIYLPTNRKYRIFQKPFQNLYFCLLLSFCLDDVWLYSYFCLSIIIFFKIQNHCNWCGCVFGSLYVVVVVFSFSSIVTMTKHFFKRLFFREINCLFTFFNCHQQHPLLLRCLLRHRTSRESNCHAKVA